MATPSDFTLNNISRVLDLIASNAHDCDTIKSLIIDLRPCCPNGSIIRELGDFIAHPERDRGILHKNIANTFEGMVRFFRASKGLPVDGPAGFGITPSFTDVEIVDSLFDILTTQRILPASDSRLPRIKLQRDSICICLLSLIQGATFALGDKRIPGFISIVPATSARHTNDSGSRRTCQANYSQVTKELMSHFR